MKKKTYYCSIKSHTDAPDWERECEARSKEEACQIFARMASGSWEATDGRQYDSDWSVKDIEPYVEEVKA